MMRHQPANLLGGSYRDENLLWSSQDTVNWLPTVTQQEGTRTQVKFATPPGLSYFTQCGDGPIRGARDVEGKLFVVSGNGLYEIALDGTPTNRGIIPGVGRVSMSHNKRGYGNQLLIANGDAGYVWDTTGTTLTKITDSGYPGAVMVDYLDHFLIQVEPFGRFWFHSNLDNASDYNALDRYDAEAATDKMVGIASNQLEAVVFNGKTIEFFVNTGATTGTFQSKRTVIERGCAGRHTIVKLDNTLMWLGNDGVFYRLNGYGAQPISQGPISRAIAGLNWANAFGFAWEDKGYKVAYWTFPDGQTWGYDPTQPPGYQWHRRESYGLDRWRLNTCTLWQGMWIGGDYRAGALYRLDWDAFTELGEPMVSERTGPTVSDNQNAVICPYLELIFDTGSVSNAAQLPPTLSLSGDLGDAEVGDAVTGSYEAAGGVAPYTFSLASGTFPTGGTLQSDGDRSGTFTAAGSFAWVVMVTDALGNTATLPDTCEVTEVLVSLFVAADNTTSLLQGDGASFPNSVATGLTTATSNVCVQATGGRVFHLGSGTEGRSSPDGTNFVACTGLTTTSGFTPGNGSMIKIGTEWQLYHDGLHVSTDGIAFSARSVPGGSVYRPVFDGTTVVAIFGGRFLQSSTDSGVTFSAYNASASLNATEGVQRLLTIPGVGFRAFGRDGSGSLLIGSSATGLTGSWSFSAGPATAIVHGVARDPDSGRILIVLQTGACWYSDNNGSSWTAGAAVPYAGASSFPPLTTNNMIRASDGYFYFGAAQGGGINRIYRTPDGVSAWAQVYTSSSGNAIESLAEFLP